MDVCHGDITCFAKLKNSPRKAVKLKMYPKTVLFVGMPILGQKTLILFVEHLDILFLLLDDRHRPDGVTADQPSSRELN